MLFYSLMYDNYYWFQIEYGSTSLYACRYRQSTGRLLHVRCNIQNELLLFFCYSQVLLSIKPLYSKTETF